VDDTVAELRRAEALGPEHSLLIAAARTCAERADSSREDARMYLKLLVALDGQLRGLAPAVGDGWDALLALAAGPAGTAATVG
jgi:hypothetical protein